MKKGLVFLGGTCGNNNWRDGFIQRLTDRGVDPENLFNPVVPNWNEEAQKAEDAAKESSQYMLYYLGDPMEPENHVSFYSLAEGIMGLYDSRDRTIVVFDPAEGMPKHAVKAHQKACKDLKKRFPEALIFETLAEAEDWLAENLVSNGTVSA